MKKIYIEPKLVHLDLSPAEILAASDALSNIDNGAINEGDFGNSGWEWLGAT